MTDNRRVLVTGANGFLGKAVVEALRARHQTVRAAMRDTSGSPRGVETVVVGDLATLPDWLPALKDVDCVVHTAGRAHQMVGADAKDMVAFRRINVDATLALAHQAVQAGVRRLIFISSAHVNGGSTHGKGFRSDDAPQPTGPYAQSKLDAEIGLADIARQTGLEVVIIRPPLITGPGVKGNLASLYSAIRRGLPLPFASVTGNRRDLVSCATLCDLVVCCLDHPDAVGQTFMVSDGTPLSTRGLIEAMATEIDTKPRLIPVPVPLLRALLTAIGRGRMASQLTEDLEIDIARTCERLNWEPPRQGYPA